MGGNARFGPMARASNLTVTGVALGGRARNGSAPAGAPSAGAQFVLLREELLFMHASSNDGVLHNETAVVFAHSQARVKKNCKLERRPAPNLVGSWSITQIEGQAVGTNFDAHVCLAQAKSALLQFPLLRRRRVAGAERQRCAHRGRSSGDAHAAKGQLGAIAFGQSHPLSGPRATTGGKSNAVAGLGAVGGGCQAAFERIVARCDADAMGQHSIVVAHGPFLVDQPLRAGGQLHGGSLDKLAVGGRCTEGLLIDDDFESAVDKNHSWVSE